MGMESLHHNELQKTYRETIEALAQQHLEATGEKLERAKVEVTEDPDHFMVILTIAGNSLIMSISQARDLALELRQAANSVEKNQMDVGLYKGNKPKRGKL